MKKYVYGLSLLVLFLLFACEDTLDDDPEEEGESPGSETGYYTVADYSPLQGLTEAQVREHYNSNYANQSTYSDAVSNLDIAAQEPGGMTSAGLTDFQRRTNFFLSFYQLPPVGESVAETNEKCQEAALSMIIEGEISHYPLDDGYTYANETAQEAASSSNLAIAWSSTSFSYTKLLDNLIMDIGVASTGHRRWFLLPGQEGAGYGYAYDENDPTYGNADVLIQWVKDYNQDTTYDKPVLYPPAGAFPIEFTVDSLNRLVDFSLYWTGASFSSCSVTMTDADDTTIPLEISVQEDHNQNSLPPAALIWSPQQTPVAGDSWTVTITGISGKSETSLTYTISFMELGEQRSPSIHRVAK